MRAMKHRLFFLFLLLAATSAFAQVERNGALPAPLPLFNPVNWWNIDISEAPVDANSAAFITFIGTGKQVHPDFGGDNPDDEENPAAIYGMPYIVVPGTQPLVPVNFYEFPGESDLGAPGRPVGYPIPPIAITETKWKEGGRAGNDPTDDGDRHMLIVDRDNRLLFELYDVYYDTNTAQWQAASGAAYAIDSNARRPEGWTSADAAGLAILPGLVRYDEVYESNEPIRHAFRVTVRATNGYVFPGSHVAGSNSSALPMGARLRLKASTNISTYPAALQRVFQAMKTYGLIVADNGTDMYVQGTYDTRWDNGILNPAFHALKASDFEVIKLGWQPMYCWPYPMKKFTLP